MHSRSAMSASFNVTHDTRLQHLLSLAKLRSAKSAVSSWDSSWHRRSCCDLRNTEQLKRWADLRLQNDLLLTSYSVFNIQGCHSHAKGVSAATISAKPLGEQSTHCSWRTCSCTSTHVKDRQPTGVSLTPGKLTMLRDRNRSLVSWSTCNSRSSVSQGSNYVLCTDTNSCELQLHLQHAETAAGSIATLWSSLAMCSRLQCTSY